MAPLKYVIKCGNFAVLVDLHVVPLGGQEDASWFTADHVEEVTTLVRDAVDQRVKQYAEYLYNRRQPKQKKELTPAAAFIVKGVSVISSGISKSFNLVANFLKRHSNLRCITKQEYGDLRVFPERYVVCVSWPEDATAHHGNPSLAATELSEQSRSEYFSREGETQEPLKSPTKTKKTALQKIAKQAGVQRERFGFSVGEKQMEHRACQLGSRQSEGVSDLQLEAEHQVDRSSASNGASAGIASAGPGLAMAMALARRRQTESSPADSVNPSGASVVFCPHEISPETRTSGSREPSDAEDPRPQKAKRTCLGRPPAATQTHSADCFTQTSKHDPLPLPPLPPDVAKAESKAFPVSECKKTTLEVELLTPGKRAQRLPLTSNNTAQTNQNRLAASLRGLSVKLASSGSSISSRSTFREEGSENVPRTSRLRRLKRS